MKDQFNAVGDGHRGRAAQRRARRGRRRDADSARRRVSAPRRGEQPTVRSRCASVTLRDVMPSATLRGAVSRDLKSIRSGLKILMAITQRLARICATIRFRVALWHVRSREVGATCPATVVWGLPESLLSAPPTCRPLAFVRPHRRRVSSLPRKRFDRQSRRVVTALAARERDALADGVAARQPPRTVRCAIWHTAARRRAPKRHFLHAPMISAGPTSVW